MRARVAFIRPMDCAGGRTGPTVSPPLNVWCNKTTSEYVSHQRAGDYVPALGASKYCHDCSRFDSRRDADPVGPQAARISHYVRDRVGNRLDCPDGGSWRGTSKRTRV